MIYFKNNSVTFDLHLTRSILEPPPWERIPQILVSIRLFLFCAPNCAELTCCVYLFKRLVNSWRRYYILFTFVSRDITLPTKVRLVKAMVFPVVMWELDCEESWAPKNWCFWTVVLEKTLVSPLGCKEIQPVHSEGDQPWDFLGRNDARAETPVLWPPHAKSWLIGKDSDAGRDWGQEEKGTTEDEMAG